MRASAPDVEVTVADALGGEVLDAVGHADTDAGLIHLAPADPAGAPGANAKPRVGAARAGDRGRRPRAAGGRVGGVEHPQARLERVDLAALRDGVLIAPARAAGPGLHEHVIAAWRSVDGDPDRIHETGTTTTALALVQGGAGVAIMPRGARRGRLARPGRGAAAPAPPGGRDRGRLAPQRDVPGPAPLPAPGVLDAGAGRPRPRPRPPRPLDPRVSDFHNHRL